MHAYPRSVLSAADTTVSPSSRLALSAGALLRALLQALKPSPLSRHERRWAIAGLIVAQVMVVMLYMIVSGNVAQAQSKRDAAGLAAQERSRCHSLDSRLEREQCLLNWRLGGEAREQLAQR